MRVYDSHFGCEVNLEAVHRLGEKAQSDPIADEVVTLFDQLRDRLLRYLLSLGLDAPDGEEVIQEAFLALFLHLQRGKPRHNLRGWIFRVCHNLGLKQRDSAQRDRQNVTAYDRTATEKALVDHTPGPEDELAWNERRVRLLHVWHALPAQDRRCLALRAEGLTYREIAQVVEISLGAVSLSLARSLARFAHVQER